MMKPVYIRKEERQKVGGGDCRKREEREGEKLERESENTEDLGFTINNPIPKKRMMGFDWEDTSIGIRVLPRCLVTFGWVDRSVDRKRVDYRHWSLKKLSEMHEGDWRVFNKDFSISYKGKGDFSPIRSWHESNLDTNLLVAVKRAGYKIPSPIQMAAIPLALQKRDVIGISPSGTGKTAAFVLPMLNYFTTLDHNSNHGPYAVVLAPTIELAHQIKLETVRLACYLGGIKVVGIQQQQGFRFRQCDVLIATPGALLDCLEVLKHCKYVVVDEADQMIEMPQVCAVLDAMPEQRTVYMFSATMMPRGVERLARNYLRKPVVVDIGMPNYNYDKMVQLETMLHQLNTADDDDDVAKKWDADDDDVAKKWDSTTLHRPYTRHVTEPPKKWDADDDDDVANKWDSTTLNHRYTRHVINYDMPASIEPRP